MYARSTTVMARPELIDDGIAFVDDEVMPMIMELDGCIGLSMIVDRRSGRCIATSAWRDLDTMRATESLLTPMRDRAAMAMGGEPMVEEWEIAALHRAHRSNEGACVRVSWMQMERAHVDHAVDIHRMHTLAAMDDVDGFCSASLFIDRNRGMVCWSATYTSMHTMERGRERESGLLDALARETGATVTDVCEFELALAHLHVPEMA